MMNTFLSRWAKMTEEDDDYIMDEVYDPQSRFDKKYEPEFWKKKKLQDLSHEEWELLCDGCGKCCLNKLEIKNKIKFTNAHCRFLDCKTCLCQIYNYRFVTVPDCVDITYSVVGRQPRWLPQTCAYWLLYNGKDLPSWHPLITGRADSVHNARMSLKERDVISESKVRNYEDHIIDWEDV
jgi:uncharacterized cysteine cluster protein YcgN (CxxCxxCC family)